MKNIRFCVFALLLAVLFSALPAFAADAAPAAPSADSTIMGTTYRAIGDAAKTWSEDLIRIGKYLFFVLFTISMVWKFGQHLLTSGHNIGGFFFELIQMIVFGGFWYWSLDQAGNILNAIVASFQIMAGRLGPAGGGVVDPGDIMTTLSDSATTMNAVVPNLGWFDGFILSAAIWGMYIFSAVVAANLLVLLCTAKILCFGGVFYFGFAASPWTSDIAKNYYKTVLGIGVNIYATILLVKISSQMFVEFAGKFAAQHGSTGEEVVLGFENLAAVVVACIVMGMLIMKIPPMLAGVVSGGMGGMSPAISGAQSLGWGKAAVSAPGKAFAAAGNARAAIGAARAKMSQDNKTRAAEGKPETTSTGGKMFEVAKNLVSAAAENYRKGNAPGGTEAVLEKKIEKAALKEKEAKTLNAAGGGADAGNPNKSSYASSVPGADVGSGSGQGGGLSSMSSGGSGSGGGSGFNNAIGASSGAGAGLA